MHGVHNISYDACSENPFVVGYSLQLLAAVHRVDSAGLVTPCDL